MRIDKGVYTSLSIDLQEFDFTTTEKVVLTVKNSTLGKPIITREFTEPGLNSFVIEPEEAEKLDDTRAVYDIDKILKDGRRFKLTENLKVKIRRGVGSVNDG